MLSHARVADTYVHLIRDIELHQETVYGDDDDWLQYRDEEGCVRFADAVMAAKAELDRAIERFTASQR